MSLREQALEAAGGTRWETLQGFTGHLLLSGTLLQPLSPTHSFKEIVAEGDFARRSVRISGFSDTGAVWGFSPEFVTIQRDDGAFVGARRMAAPRPFQSPKDETELIYLCGLSIWNCMTAPAGLLGSGAQTEDLGACSEHGETWRRLKVTAPEGVLAYAREAVMYFGDDNLLRRTDFDMVCGQPMRLADYASAHQSFSGVTLATLHRIVDRGSPAKDRRVPPVLDIELFDAIFEGAPGRPPA
jgi:hypothetical protein